MAQDAFGQHYLTDAFSAGHMRTARLGITQHWNAKVPMFYTNLQMFMAEEVAKYVEQHGNRRQRWVSVDFKMHTKGGLGVIPPGAFAQVSKELAKLPPMPLGNVVGLAVHDWENKRTMGPKDQRPRGVVVRVQGRKLRVVGDGRLVEQETSGKAKVLDLRTMNAAVAAVQASVSEIRQAYALGRRKAGAGEVLARLRRAGKGLFAAERMLPQAVPDAQLGAEDKSLKWDYANVNDLLADGRMAEALSIFAASKAGEFKDIVAGLDPIARDAMQRKIIDEMKGGPDRAQRCAASTRRSAAASASTLTSPAAGSASSTASRTPPERPGQAGSVQVAPAGRRPFQPGRCQAALAAMTAPA
jgi:hypothetical protein